MSKSTSLAQLQGGQSQGQEMENSGMEVIDQVMDAIQNAGGEDQGYYEEPQSMPPQQPPMGRPSPQQQAQMMAAQQQHAQMMAAQQHHAQMMAAQQQAQMMAPPLLPAPSAVKAPQSLVEKVLAELKDSLIVLIVFVVLNFEPVQKIIGTSLSRFTGNPYVLLLVRGALAGALFYIVKRIILNQ
jgi:histone deacetylase complex regulatory component SIN3